MKTLFNRFLAEDEGQDLIEYALLAGLISLVCVLAITNAGQKVSALFVPSLGRFLKSGYGWVKAGPTRVFAASAGAEHEGGNAPR